MISVRRGARRANPSSPRLNTADRVLTPVAEFQRLYTPSAFRDERVLWRSVIQLNVVRSVRTILDTVTDARRRELPVSSASDESDDGASERVRLPVYLEALAMRDEYEV